MDPSPLELPLEMSGSLETNPLENCFCSCWSRRLVSRSVRSTRGLRGGGGGGTLEQVGKPGLIAADGDSGCDLLNDVMGLWRTGWLFSLVVEESDSVDVQPLVRPNLWFPRSPRDPLRVFRLVLRMLCPLSISSTYLRKSRSSWNP